MRDGDIFMGAFNAEQVMYNHFGYRTPIPNLYMAGSPCHPGGAISGGAGYIAAGLIARDLGIKTVVAAMGCTFGACGLGGCACERMILSRSKTSACRRAPIQHLAQYSPQKIRRIPCLCGE